MLFPLETHVPPAPRSPPLIPKVVCGTEFPSLTSLTDATTRLGNSARNTPPRRGQGSLAEGFLDLGLRRSLRNLEGRVQGLMSPREKRSKTSRENELRVRQRHLGTRESLTRSINISISSSVERARASRRAASARVQRGLKRDQRDVSARSDAATRRRVSGLSPVVREPLEGIDEQPLGSGSSNICNSARTSKRER